MTLPLYHEMAECKRGSGPEGVFFVFQAFATVHSRPRST